MTRPDLIVSAQISSFDVDSSSLFNTAPLDNFTLDFEEALDALGNGDSGPLANALEADPTAILSNRITWGNATNGAVLTGSGLTAINDLEALEAALENGVASGAFDTLRIISGGQTILSLQFATSAITLSSGAQALTLRGALPTRFQDIFDFLGNLGNVLNEMDLATAATVLRDFDLEGLRLTDAGKILFDVTLNNAGLRITAAGGEFRVDGTLPAQNLGTLVELFQDLIALDESAAGLMRLDQLDGVEITGISLRAVDGTQLIRTTGSLNDLEQPFNTVTIQGTPGNDRNVYPDGFGGAAQIIVALEAGDDSAELNGDDFVEGFIDGPLTVNGGAGFDTVVLSDFRAQQVVFDFGAGTVSAIHTADVTAYSFNITDIEAAEVTTFQRAVILGDQNANTAIARNAFGLFEFDGGGGTDILDLTGVQRNSSDQEGLRQSDLLGFTAFYGGGKAITLSHSDIYASFLLSDVEQIRVKGDAGGTVLLTLNQVLAANPDNAGVILGTSGMDSLKGKAGAAVLLGYSGADYLYGDGIQANLTGAVAGQVFRMYQATLDRAPDAAGYEGWVTSLSEGTLGLQQMARGFVRSTEFQNTYGSLDDTGFVNLLYQNVLGRAADAAGLQGWLDVLGGGGTREGVVLGFSQSAEFQRDTAADAASFALSQSETHWSDEIYRVYRATLDRDPDVGGFQGWAELLGSGTAFDTMIGGFVNSPEFRNTYGALDDEGFVELLYQNVLDRAADAGGLQGWLDVLGDGGTRAQVVRGFSQSSEFQRDTAADLKDWMLAQGTDDRLVGGADNNTLTGGLYSDVFVFNANAAGTTRLLDFEAWDYVKLEDFGYQTVDDALVNFEQRGADVVFADDNVTAIFENAQLDTVAQNLLL